MAWAIICIDKKSETVRSDLCLPQQQLCRRSRVLVAIRSAELHYGTRSRYHGRFVLITRNFEKGDNCRCSNTNQQVNRKCAAPWTGNVAEGITNGKSFNIRISNEGLITTIPPGQWFNIIICGCFQAVHSRLAIILLRIHSLISHHHHPTRQVNEWVKLPIALYLSIHRAAIHANNKSPPGLPGQIDEWGNRMREIECVFWSKATVSWISRRPAVNPIRPK